MWKRNIMIYRYYMSKWQEVHAGLIDNTLSSVSNLRQYFKPKSWVTKWTSRVTSYHARTKMHMNWRKNLLSGFSFANWKYRKESNSSEVWSTPRRKAKPAVIMGKMGFCLLGGIPTTFLGPTMLTLSPSLGEFKDSVPTLAPDPHAPWSGNKDVTGPLKQHSSLSRPRQGAALTLVLHSRKPSRLLRREAGRKFTQQFSQLIWDFSTFSQWPCAVLPF